MSKKNQKKKEMSSYEDPPLNAKTLNRLKEGFDQTAKNGKVLISSLGKLLQNSKEKIEREDIDDVLIIMGKGGKDSFTFDEYCDFIKKINSPMRIIEAFQTFDKNKDGIISKYELGHILTSFNNMDKNEIAEIFEMFDLNKDGELSYKEFVTFWDNK